MNNSELSTTLTTLFSELLDGAHRRHTYMLNVGDDGLLASLDKLSADAVSRTHAGGASIAAHVDHLRYGLSLMNRWHEGEENPWKDADWTASWRKTNVTEAEWSRLRAELRQEAHRFLETLAAPRELNERQLTALVSNIPHLAYHLGAIRQIDRARRGPTAEEEVAAKKAR
jgi:hypothetical protein